MEPPETRATHSVGPIRVSVLTGDVTALPGRRDAVVSPDDSSLGGQVDIAALIRSQAASDGVDREAADLAGWPDPSSSLSLGDVVVTRAGALRADHLIHAVVYDERGELVMSAFLTALSEVFELCGRRGFETLALPIPTWRWREPELLDLFFQRAAEVIGEVAWAQLFAGEVCVIVETESQRVRLDHELSCASEQFERQRRELGEKVDVIAARLDDRLAPALGRCVDGLGTSIDCAEVIAALLALVEAELDEQAEEPLAQAMAEARRLRERAVHTTSGEDDGRLLGDLRATLEELVLRSSVLFIDGEPLSGASIDPPAPVCVESPEDGPPEGRAGEAKTDEHPMPRATPESDAASATRPRQPRAEARIPQSEHLIERLARLIETNLHHDDREHFERLLEDRRMAGGLYAGLLELCQTQDPEALLIDECGRRMLERMVWRLGVTGQVPLHDCHPSTLAQKVLEKLGFTPAERPRGIVASREQAERQAHIVRAATDDGEIRAAIIQGSIVLERTCADLLRFYGTALFGAAWDREMASRSLLPESCKPPSRMSLGGLIDILERLDAYLLDTPEAHPAERWRTLLGGRPVLGGVIDDLRAGPPIRNKILHARDDQPLEGVSGAELRSCGRDFFDGVVLALLDHLQHGEVYPRVVAVRELVRDAYGRTHVKVVDERGAIDRIVTEDQLDAGCSYFMVPRMDPGWMRPLLIKKVSL